MTTTPAAPNELPRLIRYVEAGALPGCEILALFDPLTNLLIVNRDAYDVLTPEAKRDVLRTHRTLLIN